VVSAGARWGRLQHYIRMTRSIVAATYSVVGVRLRV
jgi:hypothetical protein